MYGVRWNWTSSTSHYTKQLRAGSYAFIYSFRFRFASGRNVLQLQAPNVCGFLSPQRKHVYTE